MSADYEQVERRITELIDIEGRSKAEVLVRLYNASRPQGLGMLHFEPKDMTLKEAQTILDTGRTYFDYLKGRVIKIDLDTDYLNPFLYDRDNGHGAAAAALK